MTSARTEDDPAEVAAGAGPVGAPVSGAPVDGTPQWPGRRTLLALGALAAAALAVAVATLDPSVPAAISQLTLALASWLTGALLYRRAGELPGPTGGAWRSFALAAVLIGCTEALDPLFAVSTNEDTGSLADLPMLLAAFPAAVGCLRMIGPRLTRDLGSRVGLDVVVVLVAAVLLTEIVVRDALRGAAGPGGSLISVGYPALAALLGGIALVVFAAVAPSRRRAAGWLLLAFLGLCTSGISGSVGAELQHPGIAVVTRVAWVVMLAAGLLAAVADRPAGSRGEDDHGVGRALLGSHLAGSTAMAAVLVLVVQGATGAPVSLLESVTGGLLVLLVFLRSLLGASDGDGLARELRRTEAYFRSLVQDSAHVTVVLDGSGRVSWVSSAVLSQLGWAGRELVGRVLLELVHSDDQAELTRLLGRSGDTATPVVLRLRTRDSGWRDVEVTGGRGTGSPHTPAARRGAVLYLQDVTARRSTELRLERLAYTDHLTGLSNRPRFETALNGARSRAADGFAACVLVVDLDGFKAVNDVAGHEAGDQVLVEVADRLRSVVRDRDLVARLGGDEFGVLVHAGVNEAMALAGRIVAELDTSYRSPATAGEDAGRGPLFPLSCSIGVAQLTAEDDEATAVRHADLALRAAKAAGKNCVRVHADTVDSESGRRTRLARDLPAAFANEELQLVYQPVVGLVERRVLGVEALVRWEHPELGPVLPHEFVILAEDDGLIVPLQRWVLQRATADLAGWLAEGHDLQLGVNISVRHVLAGCLADDVRAALAEAGVPARRLMLELTESMLLGEDERGLTEVTELQTMGCIISLDDFGRGSSSFAHLARFPVDVLKMDRSFVTGLEVDARRAVLVRGVVELGERLGIDVVAGGVETEEQLATLRTLGCRFVQGWLLGRPVPAGDLLPLVDGFDASVLDAPGVVPGRETLPVGSGPGPATLGAR